MRPLIWMGQNVFTINGRRDFHAGKSQNPTIGTVQDWFILNTIYFAHPVHVHLINFQVIGSYDVRVLALDPNEAKTQCAFYELDFILAAINYDKSSQGFKKYSHILKDGLVDYTYLCVNRYTI